MQCGRYRQQHDGRSLLAPAATIAILLIPIATCIMKSPLMMREVHAYSPSIGTYRRHHCLAPRTTLQQRRQRPLISSCHWSRNDNARNIHLFGAGSSDTIEGATKETMVYDESFNGDTTNGPEIKSNINGEIVFENLSPSTMAFTKKLDLVMTPATGQSSSVLDPLQEYIRPQQAAATPLFQSNNNPSEFNTLAKTTTWKERLVDVSNIASLLCVLDCTLLPLVSVAIPALSWGVEFVTRSGVLGGATTTAATGSNSIMVVLSSFLAYLPELSHGIALYFVIPVGLLTTVVNYFFGHKEVRFSLLSFIGVALVYVANSSSGVGIPSVDAWLHSWGIAAAHGSHAHVGHVHSAGGAVMGAATGMMPHTSPEGLAHRMTNTLGCAFLLGSNYFSKKYMEEMSQGCAASTLAEAWGGDSGGKAVCPPGCNCGVPEDWGGESGGKAVCQPGCNCEVPSYGTNVRSSSRIEEEAFFQWKGPS